MKAKIYQTIDKQVIKDWQKLWEKSSFANYANAPQWFLSAVETFEFKNYAIIALYEKEKLIAIGALVKEKRYGLNFYTVAPGDFTCGIPFLIDLDNNKIVQEFKKQLLLLGHVFLSNIPTAFLEAFGKDSSVMQSSLQTVNYFLPIIKDSSGQALIVKRNKLMHRVKTIQEKFTLHSFNGVTMEGLDKAFELDDQSRKQSRGYNAFNSVEVKNFYKNLVKHFKENLCINILYLEDKPIAYEIGFLIGKNYFGSQMAYVAEYKQYSPGKVILVKLVDFLASKDIKKLDCGSGDSPIKQLLTDEKRDLYEIILSDNKFVRNYSKYVGILKQFAYDKLHQNIRVYSLYRRIRKILPL